MRQIIKSIFEIPWNKRGFFGQIFHIYVNLKFFFSFGMADCTPSNIKNRLWKGVIKTKTDGQQTWPRGPWEVYKRIWWGWLNLRSFWFDHLGLLYQKGCFCKVCIIYIYNVCICCFKLLQQSIDKFAWVLYNVLYQTILALGS